ncbi:MAG: PQQ-dependent sugar dehydrogenase [Anaerolineae bacterium]
MFRTDRATMVTMVLVMLALAFAPAAYAQEAGAPVTSRSAPPDPDSFQLEDFATGLTRPLDLTHAGDGSGRLFVVQQSGAIVVIQDGEVLSEPFLDVSGLLSQDALGSGYSERGLLGLAFHPDYAENGRFFINYTDANGNTVVAEYRVSDDDPNRADPDSARVILRVNQPFGNHNGGQLAFGPDGYFYIGLGDGGSAGDPQGNGQNPFTLLGSILRIDIDNGDPYAIPEDNPFADGSGGAPEVWDYGLRNPWRFSFDTATGDLYIGDVGQNEWEEISIHPAGSPGGLNFGWNAREGGHPYGGGGSAQMVPPIAEYNHDGHCSVTGGYVYRGAAIPDLEGVYVFGDWCSGFVWGTYRDEAGAWQMVELKRTFRNISAFGQDEAGELYLVDDGQRAPGQGRVLRFVPSN